MTVPSAKRLWRQNARAARAERSDDERRAAGDAAATVLAEHWAELGAPRVVAAFVSVGTEPDTAPLLTNVLESGARLLLPILLEDDDLDWGTVVEADELAHLTPGRRGIPEPTGPRSRLDADLIICPALAVDGSGTRVGQGGGSYDRALATLPASTLTLAYVFGSEVLAPGTLPHDDHDVLVDGALTPSRLLRF